MIKTAQTSGYTTETDRGLLVALATVNQAMADLSGEHYTAATETMDRIEAEINRRWGADALDNLHAEFMEGRYSAQDMVDTATDDTEHLIAVARGAK
jgi:hypothetical protein